MDDEKALRDFLNENPAFQDDENDKSLIFDEELKSSGFLSNKYKTFNFPEDVILTDQLQNKESNFKLPKFLQKFTAPLNLNQSVAENNYLGKDDIDNNINSIASVFSKDHEEVSGLRRVFQKSIIFLSIHLFSFLILCLIGLNLFRFNFLISFFFILFYLAVSNTFYIVVADRSYVWLSLLGQILIIIFINSFYGLGFSLVTLGLGALILLFSYLAYTELEKVQLSSRLFSVSHITNESSRILFLAIILVLVLGVFNSIRKEGSANFISRVFLENNIILDNFVVTNRGFSLNKYLLNGVFTIKSDNTTSFLDTKKGIDRAAVLRDFLKSNYRSGTLVSEDMVNTRASVSGECIRDGKSPLCTEGLKILDTDSYFASTTNVYMQCVVNPIAEPLTLEGINCKSAVANFDASFANWASCIDTPDSAACIKGVTNLENRLLYAWQRESFTNVNTDSVNFKIESPLKESDLINNITDIDATNLAIDKFLSYPLKGDDFRELSKIYYYNTINNIETVDTENSILPLPAIFSRFPQKSIIPAAFAIIVYLLFTVFSFLILMPAYFLTFLIWHILKLFGFVQIEIETVESEIVSI